MFASCKLFRLFAKQKLFGKLFGKPVEKCLLLVNYLDCLSNRNCLVNCLANPLKSACKLFRLFAKQKLFGKLFGKPVGEGWVGSLRYHQLVSTSLGVPDGSNERYGHM